jgi:transposase
MAPRRKENSADVRSLVIKHFENGGFYAKTAENVLLPHSTVQYMIKKYKRIKCIVNMRGRGGKRKMTPALDRIIQCKVRADHQKTASVMKHELEKEMNITIHVILSKIGFMKLFFMANSHVKKTIWE